MRTAIGWIRPVGMTGLLLSVGACAGRVRPDDMSAAAHRSEAQSDDRIAAYQRARYRPSASWERSVPVPGFATPQMGADLPGIYNATEYRLTEAVVSSRHARLHRAAAASLDALESTACAGVADVVRATCPLLSPVARVLDVNEGVRIEFTPDVDVRALLERMRCHYAYAEDRGFPADLDCQLYVRGLDIHASFDGRAVEVVAAHGSRALTGELRRRAHGLVAAAAPATP